MIKAVIFDLDGTLLDTLASLEKTGNQMLRDLGFAAQESDKYRYFVGDGAATLVERALVAAGDAQLVHLEEGMRLFRSYFKEWCSYGVRPYDGIVELLDTLRKKGVKTAVLSNKPHAQTLEVIGEYFGGGAFEIVRGQMDDVPKKPDPAGANHIVKELGIRPDDCLYVGDTDVDMKTGLAAGLFTVGVLWGFRTERELRENGAMALVEKPDGILDLVGQTR
ncbi:MAG: HAD family hydrolase [Christensenella sp.]|uniref:HAD family hydrolase n=1 Tax=Christensenella sp. TaxID=1935934 RepID=UPI002B20D389|nr:HAD family hydrolase [Christensenella sp.]MEA5004282.1 HAD family hydrolase [Christensenella sp.]